MLVVWLYLNQERLLFPGSSSQGKPEAVLKPPADTELVRLTTRRGEKAVALFGPAMDQNGAPLRDAVDRPTVLIFYGNGGRLERSIKTVQQFRAMGFNVLMPEYLGFGMSEGRPGERGCRDTADAALAHLRSRKDIDTSRIVLFGYSLGGAVAVDLASREQLAGLVIFNTFTSMTEMAARLYPQAPTFLLRHPFRSLDRIAQVSCPIFIAHGDQDALIPGEMSRRLERAAITPVRRIEVPGAGHNDLMSTAGDDFYRELKVFIANAGARGQGSGASEKPVAN